MGCSGSKPRHARQSSDDSKFNDESFSFSKLGNLNGASAELLTEGGVRDHERMSAILQLSVSLSLLATERGRTETQLCDAVVAARPTLSTADRISIWRVRTQQPNDPTAVNRLTHSEGFNNPRLIKEGSSGDSVGQAANPGFLVCLASDALGMQGRSLSRDDAGAPPCAALSVSTSLDAPPLLVDLSDPLARAELEGRYGLRLKAALYVPIVAQSTSQQTDTTDASASVVQLGVIELVIVDKTPASSKQESPMIPTRELNTIPSNNSSANNSPALNSVPGHKGSPLLLPRELPRQNSGPLSGATSGSALKDGGLNSLPPISQSPEGSFKKSEEGSSFKRSSRRPSHDSESEQGTPPVIPSATSSPKMEGSSFKERSSFKGRTILDRATQRRSSNESVKSASSESSGSRDDDSHLSKRNAEGFTMTMRKQLGQLGGYLATALQSLRLSDDDLQGERLLYRMLPKHIVTQLQKRVPEDFIVESCEHAYVLFSDIVSFTAYCSRREPRDVVVMLNSMFATFDALLSKHKVHKVTTIGDAYVAATGLPFMESATPHLDIVNFALDMVAAVQTFVTEDGERMQIRIGIHAGPVAAGVVGIAMPRYCLFGETVTIAEQLEERSQGKDHLPLPHSTHTMHQHHSFLTHTLSPLTRRQDPHLYRRL